ncbi:hypothetical protein ABH923_000387 [Leifsonia sp. EB41]
MPAARSGRTHSDAATYPPAGGTSAPAGVAAASRRPASALPMLKPTLRTIWLMESTLAVSGVGTPSSTSRGMTAETPPTPKPRTVMASRTSASEPVPTASRTAAAATAAADSAKTARAPVRGTIRGATRPATNPSAENGMSAAPAATPGSANP